MRTVPRSRAARVVVAVLAVIVVGGVAGIVAGCSGGSHPAGAIQTQSPASQPASSPSSPTASAAGASGGQTVGSLCSSQRRAVVGGAYMVQNDEWGSGAPECVAVATGGGFTVARSAIANSACGSPGGYPSIYRGCHWGICTPGSGLPVPASRLLHREP